MKSLHPPRKTFMLYKCIMVIKTMLTGINGHIIIHEMISFNDMLMVGIITTKKMTVIKMAYPTELSASADKNITTANMHTIPNNVVFVSLLKMLFMSILFIFIWPNFSLMDVFIDTVSSFAFSFVSVFFLFSSIINIFHLFA